jgi:hypothetical protein
MDQQKIKKRIDRLLEDLRPLAQHNDISVYPTTYDIKNDAIHLEVIPKSSLEWAKTVYKFTIQPNLKYDRGSHIYGIDGQPRCSYSGMTFVRFISPFLDGSKVGLHIWSQQPSHEDAEDQLSELYRRFLSDDSLEPIEVFKKYW